MRCILLFLAILGICASISAQNSQAVVKSTGAVLTLKETSYNFGKIQQGRPFTHEFEIVNTGTETLKLENVQASCGCTTPSWKKDPIPPQGKTKIEVGFNAASEGPFEKSIVIFYNGGQEKIITIKGNVYKSPVTSAPLNATIELLKQAN